MTRDDLAARLDAWYGENDPTRVFVSGDDPVTCGVCGCSTSLAMIGHHLVTEHDVDPEDIANAPVIDETEEA